MKKFHIIHKSNGRFSIENESEVLAELDSRESAETACAALNHEPGRNPVDVFCGGRWSEKQKPEVA